MDIYTICFFSIQFCFLVFSFFFYYYYYYNYYYSFRLKNTTVICVVYVDWLYDFTVIRNKKKRSKRQVYIYLSIDPNVFHLIYEWRYTRMMMMMEKRSHLPLSPVGKSSSEMRKSWRNVMKNNLLIFFIHSSQKKTNIIKFLFFFSQ